MSRVPPITRENYTDAQQRFFERITGGKRSQERSIESFFTPDGGLRGPFNVLLYSPGIGDIVQRLGEAVRFESTIPSSLRELAILTVAVKWNSQYEWWAHSKIGRREGLSEPVLKSMQAGERPDFDNPEEAVIYGFTREMIDTHRVSDHLYGEAVNLLGEAGVVELVALVGYYTTVAMLLNVFEIPVPAGEKEPFPSYAGK